MNFIEQYGGTGIMKRTSGFALLDVILAILVFAVGMLALASLQTNLTRSSVDSNTRTVATNLGEQIIERLRSFRRITTDPNGVVFAFADIDSNYVETLLNDGAGNTVTSGGQQFTIAAEVAGYDFNEDRTAVTPTAVAVAGALYDFKRVNLTISWNNDYQFQVDEETQVSSADMNTGSVSIVGVIPPIPSLAGAVVAATDDGELGGIPVDYTPGLRPDILAINLENGKFKESTTPTPEVKREGVLTETWFDVVTYSTVNESVFLRREEFLVVGCLCNDIQAAAGAKTGFLPAIWTGTEYSIWNGTAYTDGAGTQLDMVAKPYGKSADNSQSAFCDTCCRDHHDSAEFTGPDFLFNPLLPSSEEAADGDHKHWLAGLEEAVGYGKKGPKDDYLESCRMVRKDGFMRVAQDFSQKRLNAFPQAFLETEAGAEQYSSYLATAVDDFYVGNLDALDDPTVPFPGSAQIPTELPFLGTLTSQQLRSRGVYVDHVSVEAETLIDCIRDKSAGYVFDPDNPDAPTPGDQCGAPGVQNYLEVFPFFEVQTTFLSNWNEDPPGTPVEVTTAAITAQNPIPDRGVASLVDTTNNRQVTVITEMNKGNVGLAAVNPVRPADSELISDDMAGEANLYIDVNLGPPDDGSDPPAPSLFYWSANLDGTPGGVNWSSVTVSATDCITSEGCNTFCSRTSETLSCARPAGLGSGEVVLSGYYKNAGTDLYVCATGAPAGFAIANPDPGAAVKSAIITWPNTANLPGITLSIEDSACTP